MTEKIKDKLIVALDVEKIEKAESLVKKLYPTVKLFKIGSQLYTTYGPQAVAMVGRIGGKVFLDLKFHDIPNTVASAVLTSTSLSTVFVSSGFDILTKFIAYFKGNITHPVFMMTVHTQGGSEMMQYAAKAARERATELNIEKPKIVGVTVLTSDAASVNTQEKVVELALLAKQAGLDGVVCSVLEARAVREACGEDFIIITPGIRLMGGELGDQKRVNTPAAAVAAGSNFIVVGRPVLQAPDPLVVVKEILADLK